MENIWNFFDRVNDNIEVISALMGIIGLSIVGLVKVVFKVKWKDLKDEIKKSVFVIGVVVIVFFIMCIYTSNLIVVPQIDNTSYEAAQQMLENKGIKYQVINMSEYENVNLRDTTVSLVNCNGGQHISKDKQIMLEIVSVNEDKAEEDISVIDEEDSVEVETEIEGPYADVYVYLQEVVLYKILDGGSKTPLLSRDKEISPNDIKLYNEKYNIEYTDYSDVRDAMLNIRGCLFTQIPCGKYELIVNAEGYIDYNSEVSILPENLDNGVENILIDMNSKSAGELKPFTISVYDEAYNNISEENTEAFIRVDENDMYQNIELTDDGRISNYGLLAADGIEFQVMIIRNEKEYLADVSIQKDKYSIVIILNNDGTTRVTSIEELYWNE